MIYSVYFLRSQNDSKYYIGCTSRDPNQRLIEHNSGSVASTKYRRPFTLVWIEEFQNKKEAFNREWHLKHPKGYIDKIGIIKKIEDGPVA